MGSRLLPLNQHNGTRLALCFNMIRFISGFVVTFLMLTWLFFSPCSPKNRVENPPQDTVDLPEVTTLSENIILGLNSVRIYNGRASAEGFQFFEFEGDEIRIDLASGNIFIKSGAGTEWQKGCFTSSQLQSFDQLLQGLKLCEFPGAYGQKEDPICTMAVVPPWITLRYQERIQSLGGSNDGCRRRIDFCDSSEFKTFLDNFEAQFGAQNQNCN